MLGMKRFSDARFSKRFSVTAVSTFTLDPIMFWLWMDCTSTDMEQDGDRACKIWREEEEWPELQEMEPVVRDDVSLPPVQSLERLSYATVQQAQHRLETPKKKDQKKMKVKRQKQKDKNMDTTKKMLCWLMVLSRT
ncbi:hypothetical protein MAR_017847 [Mya arenaria]|uniref:Uncharacterized protein n=1 Tax=Mya arenaria TaxID=6604 RepID=A0ABY7EFG4_MYAAR|nr:hypothetical protein MAR_017847 [Mya arenaria]